MSWFEKAKTVLIEALDMQDGGDNKIESEKTTPTATTNKTNAITASTTTTMPTTATSSAATNLDTENYLNSSTTVAKSIIGAFFDNPNANEMVTIPPRASDSPTTTVTTTVAATNKLNIKRQSAASDSIDLLSTPSPIDDVVINNSESSLELLTATTASDLQTSPDTEPSLPESIVIIASNDTSDNPDAEDEQEPDDDERNITAIGEQSIQLNDPIKTVKALALTEAQSSMAGGADSDSTQSFEDIQMQLSSKHPAEAAQQTKTELVDQSYSSTSSDIEIISNPNGDSNSTNSNTARISPLKFKETCPKQRDAAHGTIGQLKTKGHYREPSEISLLSEDSQSELDKLVNRISELNQVIEAREQRLLQSERQNAELIERNQELQAALNTVRHEESSTDANEAVQRLSALEKKFQASIRERDALRIQIKTLRDELQNKIPKDELAESSEMITTLQLEGEKLSKEILQQSNIIKKLRSKEKTTDTLLKKNAEQISQLCTETERLKKSLAAKDEVERSQIEAVHKMTTEKRKVDEQNAEYQSCIEDLQSKLNALQTSFDGVKNDLHKRTRDEDEKIRAENQQLTDLREKLRMTELTMSKREQQLREENRDLLRRLEVAELRIEATTADVSQATAPLIRQIESLQKTLNQRTNIWSKEEQILLQKLERTEMQYKSLQQIEATHNEKYDLLQTRCNQLEEQLSNALMQLESEKIALHQTELDVSMKKVEYNRQTNELIAELEAHKEKLVVLERKYSELETIYVQLQQQQRKQASELTVSTTTAAEAEAEQQHISIELQRQQQEQQQQEFAQTNILESTSPALSLADSSCNEETLAGIIDWQTDEADCISNSGRQASSGIVQGVHLNFLSNNTTTLEHLQSSLKQRDGELTQMQWELSRLQSERGVLTDEISRLTIELENAKDQLQTYEILEKSYADLQHSYDALLQMYGEKVERTEELELDLLELKQAYKLQIDELLAQPLSTVQSQQQQRIDNSSRGDIGGDNNST